MRRVREIVGTFRTFHRSAHRSAWILAFLFGLAGLQASVVEAQTSAQTLVTVRGESITEGDLQLLMKLRQMSPELPPAVRQRLIDELIERKLIEQFLNGRKIAAAEDDIQRQIQNVNSLIRRGGDDPDELFARLGFTADTLRSAMALPLAWQAYLRMSITDDQVRDVFRKSPSHWDGTEVHAHQILLKAADDAGDRIARVRQQIISGEMTFAEAARKVSEAPSAEQGGDLGFFAYQGQMPADFADEAFRLKPGDISQPFQTPFGWHLLTVTETRPGQLSLEDARPLILEELGRQKWQEIVTSERERARIHHPAR